MNTVSPATVPYRQRVRARFAKQGELRFIGHQDLARTVERLLRRAGVQLSMTEGFHPHARMSFPLALAVGIAAIDEVVEFDLAEEVDINRLADDLRAHAPPGLTFSTVEFVPAGEKKGVAARIEWRMPLPADRFEAAQARAAEFMGTATWPIARARRRAPLDIRADVLEMSIDADGLRMRLAVSQEGMARPRELLEALGLADLEQEGFHLTRTAVVLRQNLEHQKS